MSSEEKNRISRRDFMKVAAISGAALTSSVTLTSCADAETLEGASAAIPKKWDEEADVVVVGTGDAGSMAALNAFDGGASVIMIDKLDYYGGCSTLGGGNAHLVATHTFGFRAVKAPEHTVKVTVVDKDTQIPVKNAQVILHPYMGTTNNDGMTNIEVPKGNYQLYVTKKKYETFRTTVVVASDIAIQAELKIPVQLLEDS